MCAKTYLLALSLLLALGQMARADEIRGIISKFDSEKKELTIDARGRGLRGQSLTFRLADDTNVLAGGGAGALIDLQPGKRARVSFATRDGRRTALTVTVLGPKMQAPVPAEGAPANVLAGTLVRVSITDREIVILSPGPQGKETETTLIVSENAEIQRNGAKTPLAQLNEGDRVTVRTMDKNGRLAAASINVGDKALPGPASLPPKAERLRQALKIASELMKQLGEDKPK